MTCSLAQNNPGVSENIKSSGTKMENFDVFKKANSIQCCPLGKAASTRPFSHTVGLSKGFQKNSDSSCLITHLKAEGADELTKHLCT